MKSHNRIEPDRHHRPPRPGRTRRAGLNLLHLGGLAAEVNLVNWSGAVNAFIVSGWDADGDGQPDPTQPPNSLDIGTPIPTKVFEYGSEGRLSAVILPAVEHYDTRLTWFTFDPNGRQLTRTLPLGVLDEFVTTVLAEFNYDLLPDGRRAGLTERMWIDQGGTPTLQETRIDWTYDPVGRLVRESYDSHDSSLAYVTDYIFDLVGNRLLKLSDTDPAVTGPDQSMTYSYDINDRLLVETAATWDGGTSAWITDRTTLYEYGPNAR